MTVETLDLAGEVCPYTFVRAKLRLEELPLGARLEVLVDHVAAALRMSSFSNGLEGSPGTV